MPKPLQQQHLRPKPKRGATPLSRQRLPLYQRIRADSSQPAIASLEHSASLLILVSRRRKTVPMELRAKAKEEKVKRVVRIRGAFPRFR